MCDDRRAYVQVRLSFKWCSVTLRFPVIGKHLGTFRPIYLVPILNSMDAIRTMLDFPVLDDSEPLSCGEMDVLLAPQQHRIVVVQD